MSVLATYQMLGGQDQPMGPERTAVIEQETISSLRFTSHDGAGHRWELRVTFDPPLTAVDAPQAPAA